MLGAFDASQVPWLDDFLDLAGPRFEGWQEASRDYARHLPSATMKFYIRIGGCGAPR